MSGYQGVPGAPGSSAANPFYASLYGGGMATGYQGVPGAAGSSMTNPLYASPYASAVVGNAGLPPTKQGVMAPPQPSMGYASPYSSVGSMMPIARQAPSQQPPASQQPNYGFGQGNYFGEPLPGTNLPAGADRQGDYNDLVSRYYGNPGGQLTAPQQQNQQNQQQSWSQNNAWMYGNGQKPVPQAPNPGMQAAGSLQFGGPGMQPQTTAAAPSGGSAFVNYDTVPQATVGGSGQLPPPQRPPFMI